MNVRWPTIVGVDTAGMADVFGDDVATYVELLQMMCNDNLPDDLAAATAAPIDREALRRRMHKLRGSASMLGAHDIAARTTSIEANCTTDDVTDAQLAEATSTIAAQLVDIAAGVAAFQRQGPRETPAPAHVAPTADLIALERLLHDHDLGALEVLDDHAAALNARLGESGHRTFVALVHSLKFTEAADLLANNP